MNYRLEKCAQLGGGLSNLRQVHHGLHLTSASFATHAHCLLAQLQTYQLEWVKRAYVIKGLIIASLGNKIRISDFRGQKY